MQQVYVLPDWIDEVKNKTGEAELVVLSEPELEKISQLATPNKVLAIVKKFETVTTIPVKDKITIVLDTIQDPGNLGTIIRIADWFGVEHIVCSHECADLYNPKVVQSTMGSIARVKLMYTDIEEWLVQQKNIGIYAASVQGENTAFMKKITEGILIIGNESKGIRPGILRSATTAITISKKGKAESLNAAVATGILLSHLI